MIAAVLLVLVLPASEPVVMIPSQPIIVVVDRPSLLPPVLKIGKLTAEAPQISERIVLQPNRTKIGSQHASMFNLKSPPVTRSGTIVV